MFVDDPEAPSEYRPPYPGSIDLDRTADDNPWNRWGGGVAAPLALLVIGGRIALRHTLTYSVGRGRDGGYPIHLNGLDVIAAALIFLFAAAYLHLHFFWTPNERLSPYAEDGKLLAAVGFALALAYIGYATIRYILAS